MEEVIPGLVFPFAEFWALVCEIVSISYCGYLPVIGAFGMCGGSQVYFGRVEAGLGTYSLLPEGM